MGNELTVSKIADLKREIDALANTPKATEAMATKHAIALVACYPGQADPNEIVAKAYLRQLRDCCAGVDFSVLLAMLDPKTGLVSKQKFLPAIAEVNEFIEKSLEPKRRLIGTYLDEIERIETREKDSLIRETITAEERERRVEMAKKVTTLMRETAEKKRIKYRLPPIQVDDPELRMKALAELESTRGGN